MERVFVTTNDDGLERCLSEIFASLSLVLTDNVEDACFVIIDFTSLGADAYAITANIRMQSAAVPIFLITEGFGNIKKYQSQLNVRVDGFLIRSNIKNEIQNAVKIVNFWRSKTVSKAEVKNILEKQFLAEKDHLFSQYIYGLMDGSSASEIELVNRGKLFSNKIEQDAAYMLVLVSPVQRSANPAEAYLNALALCNHMRQWFININCAVCTDAKCCALMLLNLNPWLNIPRYMQLVEYALKSYMACFEDESEIKVVAGASTVLKGLRGISQGRYQVEQAVYWSLHHPNEFKLTFFEDIDPNKLGGSLDRWLCDDVLACAFAKDIGQLRQIIYTHLQHIREKTNDENESLTVFRQDMCALFFISAGAIGAIVTNSQLAQVLNLNDADQLIECFQELMIEMIDSAEIDNYTLENKIVSQAKEFVANAAPYYRFTTQEMAARMNISANYFSSLFKKHTGVGFTEYVCTASLVKAIQLMENPCLHISEISALVGYEDSSYFSRLFRRRYGINPAKYRTINYNIQK